MSSPSFDASLLRDERSEVRLGAVQALASAPLPPVERLETLFGALVDSDWRVVAAALAGLEAHRNPETVEAVLRQLDEALDVALPPGLARDPWAPLDARAVSGVRRALRATLLVRAEPAPVLPVLRRLLEQGGHQLTFSVTFVFKRFGAASLPTLVDTLHAATDTYLRVTAAVMAWELTHEVESLLPLLVELLRKERTTEASWLLRPLGSRAAPVVTDLVVLLRKELERQEQARAAAPGRQLHFDGTRVSLLLKALEEVGGEAREAEPLLRAYLAREDCPLRGMMLRTLVAIVGPEAEPLLRAHLTHADVEARCAAAVLLHRLTGRAEEVLPLLRKALGRRSEDFTALHALAALGDAAAPAIPWVLEWLRQQSPPSGNWGSSVPYGESFLSRFPPTPAGLQLMLQRLEDADFAHGAMRVFERWGPVAPSVLPRLLQWAREHEDLPTRIDALVTHWRASGDAGPALQGLPGLLRSMEHRTLWSPEPELIEELARVLREGPAEQKEGAAEVLGLVGWDAREALPALEALHGDAEPVVRARALAASERIQADF